ncbi:hypothetical protein G4V62_04805 [Bacillaceae bacterium SIJ1]|uniref:primosomal protein N' family DNA-binding protein n=1 Tax=Litoribacterium kuwaitense TaxID=1398745 RepID=UPI0013EA78A5|nr:hypothetical protein [Litoribacterium kuwaitense]NGP44306.1 hypothetical protein [Litoribacterium kuwaitense]
MYASIIVDVPVRQTDRLFDYEIPEKWEGLVVPGMRVLVPFGPRKIQGMVIEVKTTTDILKTKPIVELLDPEPVLTEELLTLGKWLAESTLCFLISAYQAMLPSALKSTYRKKIILQKEEALSQTVRSFFAGNKEVLWEDIDAHPDVMREVQLALKQGALDLIYEAKDKGSIKKVKWVTLTIDAERAYERLSAQAIRQKDVVQHLQEARDGLALSRLTEMAQASYATVKALEEKGIVSIEEREQYRDPFAIDSPLKPPLTLSKDQAHALHAIKQACDQKVAKPFYCMG